MTQTTYQNRKLKYFNILMSTLFSLVGRTDCEGNPDEEEPMLGLRLLSLGVCLSVRNELSKAEKCFQEVLKLRKSLPTTSPDAHIDVFTYYELACIKLRSPEVPLLIIILLIAFFTLI